MIEEPLIELTAKGARSISLEINEKLKKKKLSPSLVTGLVDGCPASWFGDNFVNRELFPSPPDNPARRGSMFHKIMEELFLLPAEEGVRIRKVRPPEERTPETTLQVFDEVRKSEEFKDLGDNEDVLEWLRGAINGYYSMGGKPEMVKIAELPDKYGNQVPGVEFFVSGRLGNCSREVIGFIDRLVENIKKPSTYIIEDWKTGKEAKHYDPKDKYNKGFAEQRQQMTYKLLLEDMGLTITGARLIYPIPRDRVSVNVDDKELAQKVVESFETADEKLTEYTEANFFPFKPSALCSWCSIAKICTRAKIIPKQKFQDAYYSQPSIEELSVGYKLADED